MHLNKEVVKLDEMYHHGILGQKWGVRRFQNKDGTLTAAGQKRLEKKDAKSFNSLQNEEKLACIWLWPTEAMICSS